MHTSFQQPYCLSRGLPLKEDMFFFKLLAQMQQMGMYTSKINSENAHKKYYFYFVCDLIGWDFYQKEQIFD